MMCTGEFGNMIRLEELLTVICGELVCVVDGQRKAYASKEDVTALYPNHIVTAIGAEDGKIVLELRPWQMPKTDLNAEWVEEYRKQNQAEPSFF